MPSVTSQKGHYFIGVLPSKTTNFFHSIDRLESYIIVHEVFFFFSFISGAFLKNNIMNKVEDSAGSGNSPMGGSAANRPTRSINCVPSGAVSHRNQLYRPLLKKKKKKVQISR